VTHPVYLLSANPIAREGLRRIIADQGFAVAQVAVAVDELELDPSNEGLALIDDAVPEAQLAFLRDLAAAGSSLRPVVLATAFDLATMSQCFSEGAEGYLIKDMDVKALTAALQLIAAGHKVMPSALADQLPARYAPPLSAPESSGEQALDDANLSQRERDVLCCVMGGYPNKVIARQLDISEATIKVHVKAILRKLKVMNRTQAALWAHSRGMGSGSSEADELAPAELAA
jgi:two-component system, NarL family, nitrate/nitrite response regulator NarL